MSNLEPRARDSGDQSFPGIESVQRTWDQIADDFSQRRNKPWSHVVDWLHQLPKSVDLLIAGCGSGRHIGIGLSAGHRVEACDLSPKMVALAQLAHPSVTPLVCDIRNMPWDDSSFDAILCVATLHHLPLNEGVIALSEAKRLLRPRGRIYVTCWAPNSPKNVRWDGDVAWVTWQLPNGTLAERYHVLVDLERRLSTWNSSGLQLVESSIIGQNQVMVWSSMDEEIS